MSLETRTRKLEKHLFREGLIIVYRVAVNRGDSGLAFGYPPTPEVRQSKKGTFVKNFRGVAR